VKLEIRESPESQEIKDQPVNPDPWAHQEHQESLEELVVQEL